MDQMGIRKDQQFSISDNWKVEEVLAQVQVAEVIAARAVIVDLAATLNLVQVPAQVDQNQIMPLVDLDLEERPGVLNTSKEFRDMRAILFSHFNYP